MIDTYADHIWLRLLPARVVFFVGMVSHREVTSRSRRRLRSRTIALLLELSVQHRAAGNSRRWLQYLLLLESELSVPGLARFIERRTRQIQPPTSWTAADRRALPANFTLNLANCDRATSVRRLREVARSLGAHGLVIEAARVRRVALETSGRNDGLFKSLPLTNRLEMSISSGRFDTIYSISDLPKVPIASGREIDLSHLRLAEQTKFRQFHQEVRGRRVALVGSAVPAFGLGQEIDAFDLVVRLKRFGQAWLGDPQRFGSRTDIVYTGVYRGKLFLGGENGRPHNLRTILTELGETAWLVIRSPLKADYGPRVRSTLTEVVLGLGTAQLGQHAVVDLLRAEPSEVKLFGFDNYITVVRRGLGVPTHYVPQRRQHRSELYYRNLARHDALSNREMLQLLWRSGHISVDEACEASLTLSEDEYCEALEATLGPWGAVL